MTIILNLQNEQLFDRILWFFLSRFKNDRLEIITDIQKNISTPDDSYFKSKKHKIAYLLINYSPEFSNETLGITRRHFVDKDLAKKWMRTQQKQFHEDKNYKKNDGIEYKKVSEAINKIYKQMVGSK